MTTCITADCKTGNWLLKLNNYKFNHHSLHEKDGTCKLFMTTTLTDSEVEESLATCIPHGVLTNIRIMPNLFALVSGKSDQTLPSKSGSNFNKKFHLHSFVFFYVIKIDLIVNIYYYL